MHSVNLCCIIILQCMVQKTNIRKCQSRDRRQKQFLKDTSYLFVKTYDIPLTHFAKKCAQSSETLSWPVNCRLLKFYQFLSAYFIGQSLCKKTQVNVRVITRTFTHYVDLISRFPHEELKCCRSYLHQMRRLSGYHLAR